jgi:hypothetical protein
MNPHEGGPLVVSPVARLPQLPQAALDSGEET